MPSSSSLPPPRYRLPKTMRLTGRPVFDLLYQRGKKRMSHPLAGYAIRRTDDGPPRLGISIGRKTGNAVRRNAIKRRLREAYRLMQHELPIGTDWLLIVRPHRCLTVPQYQEKLRSLLREGPTVTPSEKTSLPPSRRGKGQENKKNISSQKMKESKKGKEGG